MHNLKELLESKSLKAKQKSELIGKLLLDKKISVDELAQFIASAKAPVKATGIEGIERASKIDPEIVTKKCFDFIAVSLTDDAPRVKWESARVIGNTAHLFTKHLDKAINHLLVNSEYPGGVVRWSAAFALSRIIELKTKYNKTLLPAIEAIIRREEKSCLRKIYATAVKN